MADGTRLKAMAEQLQTLEFASSTHNSNIAELKSSVQTIQTSVNSFQSTVEGLQSSIMELLARLPNLNPPLMVPPTNNNQSPPTPPVTPPVIIPPVTTYPPLNPPKMPQYPLATKLSKCELNDFNGEDPLCWIFNAERYISFYSIPDEQRVDIAGFRMEGQAAHWFQWMYQNRQLSSWNTLVRAIEVCFGPSVYTNHQATLFKLTQIGTVAEYQSEFERISNRIEELPPSSILACFISVLKQAIQTELVPFQPADLTTAIALARHIEAKMNTPSLPIPRYPSIKPNLIIPTVTPSNRPPLLTLPPIPAPQGSPKLTRTRRLTSSEMQQRREKGLCYFCDERFKPGHRCNPRQSLLVLEEMEENENLIDEKEDPAVELTQGIPEISLHALTGSVGPKTFRVVAQIHHRSVFVLVDSGSTHNYIHPQVARYLHLAIDRTKSFPVAVGNGDKLTSEGLCTAVKMTIQGEVFDVDFHLLSFSGADVVLGVQWLEKLGRITTDHKAQTMEFIYNNHLVFLQGILLDRSVEPITIHQLQIQPLEIETTEEPFADTPPDLKNVLTQFTAIFSAPTTLPPHRAHNHKITFIQFLPRSIRDPIVKEMLAQNIIRPSTSPFSSLVLLVRKKDGTWRFCVDYRALNAITIKDRFPIPTVDELLDELHGATVFSKLDLRSGYFLIRVHPSDVPKTTFRTHEGHYEFLVMPFGLSNAPSTFQATMNSIFHKFLRCFVLIFFDDILVYSQNWTDHLNNLRVLVNHQLFAKPTKCCFGQYRLEYLGHVISSDGYGSIKNQGSSELACAHEFQYSLRIPWLNWVLQALHKGLRINSSPFNRSLEEKLFSVVRGSHQRFFLAQNSPNNCSNLGSSGFFNAVHNQDKCLSPSSRCYFSKRLCPRL
ncbi:LOW QUALITY PROTEIN: hypothetical protein OSB04_017635 [Centaurea solstitialis]|uniref:Reverse transcriptase domain-containing protein n=1 Tax=Centaurea solstitialis TaxID=347529 RepID=A0AA38T383_9ASTR|nr:LOW QUALITY PROTEIN: hypothetical protein OSB04_017635 [Centaurea solstitialis]